MRGDSDKVILCSIAAIEGIIDAPASRSSLSDADLGAILRHADQVVTLAGTFVYECLDVATRSLCDLADGMLRTGIHDPAPIRVHVQAIRLMAPGAAVLSPEEARKVLDELAKVLKHFNFESLAAICDSHDVDHAVTAEG
jgi:hypothetical protein